MFSAVIEVSVRDRGETKEKCTQSSYLNDRYFMTTTLLFDKVTLERNY